MMLAGEQEKPPDRATDVVTIDFAKLPPVVRTITDLTAADVAVRVGGPSRASVV